MKAFYITNKRVNTLQYITLIHFNTLKIRDPPVCSIFTKQPTLFQNTVFSYSPNFAIVHKLLSLNAHC